ncbi:MAG: choice-of-anchor J domain-containing protein, partial [Muribaculaceae bacterium]|nr:choice-of-anchor J domain-containing protein [Muribaculaceae bacterium]
MIAKVPGANINLVGDVVYSETLSKGCYTIPVAEGGSLDALNNTFGSLPQNNFGSVAIDGVYYVAWQYDFFGMMLINYVDSYDMNTWERMGHTELKNTAMFATDVSLDPVSGYVYGCYLNDAGDGYVFGMADYVNCSRTAIVPLTTAWNGVAFDADGTLYALDMNGDLLTVDKGTGVTTKVGSTGIIPKYQSSAVIDHKSGRMFWSVFGEDQTGRFYEVDKTSGNATLLYQFPGNEEVCGLVVIAPEAEDYAPAAVTGLNINFTAGSLSGTVDFTAPSTYFCGETPLVNSEITYRVLANGEEIATGSCMYGEEVKAPVTLTVAGNYEFAVCVSNNEGPSPYVKAEGYIGADTPVATKATLQRDGDNLVLSWTPVTASVNGGYIDVDNITYTVTRFPDATVVADHIAATTFTEPVPAGDDLISYYYTVVAHAGDLTSGVATSNSVTTGSINPPYVSSFNKSTGLDGWTTINANNDIKVWKLKNGAAYLQYSSSLDSDDWLITPPVRLKKGNTYKVNYILYTESGSYKEKVEVKWGSSATVEGMTEVLLEPYEFSSLADVPFETYITPEADGIYYIGIHGISKKYMYGLFVKELSIAEGTNLGSPAAATNLTVVPDYNGANKATVKFNAPSVNIKGDALESLTSVELLRDGELIHTFEAPAPGAELSYTDEVSVSGNHTYTVVPYNNAGTGKETSISAFIGINKPGTVSNLVAEETSTPGEVTFTWDPATTDADGNPMNPDLITYSIFEFTTSSKYVPVVENLTATTYTFQAVDADSEQEMKQWVVCAATESGLGTAVATDLICVGPNYQMPFIESVADGKLTYNFSMDQAMGGVWRLYTSSTLAEPAAVDGDNGIFGMKGNGTGTYGSIITGKIEISGDKPVLTFYTFNIDGVNPSTGASIPD